MKREPVLGPRVAPRLLDRIKRALTKIWSFVMKSLAGIAVVTVVVLVFLAVALPLYEALGRNATDVEQFGRHLKLLETLLSWEVITPVFAALIGIAFKESVDRKTQARDERIDITVRGTGPDRVMKAEGNADRVKSTLQSMNLP